MVKVGDIFELPENVVRIVGRRGRLKNSDETKVIGMYEVIEVLKKLEELNDKGEKIKELKGKMIVTYNQQWHRKRDKKK